jgi:hypothetical protein
MLHAWQQGAANAVATALQLAQTWLPATLQACCGSSTLHSKQDAGTVAKVLISLESLQRESAHGAGKAAVSCVCGSVSGVDADQHL